MGAREICGGQSFEIGGREEHGHTDKIVMQEVVKGGEGAVAGQEGLDGGEGRVGGGEGDVVAGGEGEEEVWFEGS